MHTFYAYMNLSYFWMNSTFKMIDSALGFFIKVVDNSLSFPEHFESSQLDICSSRYSKTLRGAQIRIRVTLRAGDPCALIFSHTVRTKGPVHIDFAHTLRADMNWTRVVEFTP